MRFLSAFFCCMLSACVLSKGKKRNALQDLYNEHDKREKFLHQKEDVYLTGKIVSITDDNFDKIIADNPRVLIAFTSPSCPGCQAWIHGDFQRITDRLANAEPPVVCGEVSTGNDRELAESLHMEVEDIPRLLFFKDSHKYNDIHPSKMTPKGVVKWVNSKIHLDSAVDIKALKILSSVSEVREYLRVHRFLVLGCFKDTVPEAYINTSKELQHAPDLKFVFGYTQVPEVAKYFSVKVPGVMLFIPGDEMKAHFRGNLNHTKEIKEFVHSYRHAAVLQYEGLKMYQTLQADGRPIFFCLVGPGQNGMYTRAAFTQTALKINRRMVPVSVGMSESWTKEIGSLLDKRLPCGEPFLNLHECDGDLIAIVESLGDQENQRIFKLPVDDETGIYTEDQIITFARDYMVDNLPEFAKNDL